MAAARRDDLEPDPGLGARRRFGGRAVQQRIAAEQPDRELPVLRGPHEQPGVRGPVGGLGQLSVRAQVAPGDGGQVRGRDGQAGLAEQLGRADGQQPFVARADAGQGDPARGRLVRRSDFLRPGALLGRIVTALTAHHSRCSSGRSDC